MGNDEADGEIGSATGREERERCESTEDEEEGRSNVVRSAGLNYPDVPAQIRLPVYAHNAVRNVQVHGQPPPATSSSSFVAVAVAVAIVAADADATATAAIAPGGRRGRGGGIGTYVSTYAVCMLRGWAHIDRYVPPVAR